VQVSDAPEHFPLTASQVPPFAWQQDLLSLVFINLVTIGLAIVKTTPINIIVITVIFASPAASFIHLTTLTTYNLII